MQWSCTALTRRGERVERGRRRRDEGVKGSEGEGGQVHARADVVSSLLREKSSQRLPLSFFPPLHSLSRVATLDSLQNPSR